MSNQLTPMQEAIEKIKKYTKSLNTEDNIVYKEYELLILSCFSKSIEILTELLPKEQQVIEDVYWDGGQDIPLTDAKCKEYYNTKFKQNEN